MGFTKNDKILRNEVPQNDRRRIVTIAVGKQL